MLSSFASGRLGPGWLAFLLLLGGCSASTGGSPAPQPAVDAARSALARDTAPATSPSEQAALEAGNAALAFDLYGALHRSGQNLFFSPYSITSALAMTYAGAQGRTADEMAKALHFTLPPERLHPAFDWLDLQLASRASVPPSEHGIPFQLRIANSLWGERTESWHAPFLDTLAVDYGAGIRLTDFAEAPDDAVASIDAWASEQTDGLITELLPPSAVDATTRLVVADAVLFQAGWSYPFSAGRTAPASFTRHDGSTEQVSTMNQTAHFAYAEGSEGSGWQAVELPYVGRTVAMDVVLPAAGTEDAFDAALTADRFAAIVGALQVREVALAMPKISIAGAPSGLAGVLAGLGMPSAFGPGADFGGMCDDALFLHDVDHRAVLEVDEKGTRAAAATAGISSTIVMQPVSLTLNRSFFVAIRDLPTGTILFAGRIADPNG